jgi:hypothetical protein
MNRRSFLAFLAGAPIAAAMELKPDSMFRRILRNPLTPSKWAKSVALTEYESNLWDAQTMKTWDYEKIYGRSKAPAKKFKWRSFEDVIGRLGTESVTPGATKKSTDLD